MNWASSERVGRLAALPIPLVIVIITGLAIFPVDAVFEPSLLRPILNTLFLSAIPIVVAYGAMTSYRSSGYLSLFFLGCAMLILGGTSLFAGWLIRPPGGPNISVTLSDLGTLIASGLHLVGAVLALEMVPAQEESPRLRTHTILGYLGSLAFVLLLALASLRGIPPMFFVQGQGPTAIDYAVLGTSVLLFGVSATVVAFRYAMTRANFMYWYSLGLTLLSVGLVGVILQTNVGSLVGWVGRSAQYLAGIYFLITALLAMAEMRRKSLHLGEILFDFPEETGGERILIDLVSDAIFVLDQKGVVRSWNAGAEKMFGIESRRAIGLRFFEQLTAIGTPSWVSVEYEKVRINGTSRLLEKVWEVTFTSGSSRVRAAELSVSAIAADGGWTTTWVFRDITDRKRTASNLQKQTERLKTMREIDQAILASMSVEEITDAALSRLTKMIGTMRSSVTLFDFDRNLNIRSAVQVERETSIGVGTRSPMGEFRQESILRKGEVYHIRDLPAIVSPSALEKHLIDEGVRSYINIPLRVQGLLIGSLNLGSQESGGFTEEQIEITREVADSLATAIQQARLFEQVRAGRERLQRLSQQLVEGQEAERRYIAQELHDQVGQLLTGLKLTLQMSKSADGKVGLEEVNEAEGLADELLQQVRELSLDLRPAMLDDLGLLPALEWQITRFSGQTGMKVDFHHSGISDLRFSPEAETAIFRIAQEALTNVARHAQVDDVRLDVHLKDEVVTLQVEDRGIGFDDGRINDSEFTIGLAGMRERAMMLGGDFNLNSQPGKGTRVLVEIPLSGRLERRRGMRLE